MRFLPLFMSAAWLCAQESAQLPSNFTYAVSPSVREGELAVLAQGDTRSSNGLVRLQLSLDIEGGVQLQSLSTSLFPADYVGTNIYGIANSLTGELRRSALLLSGNSLLVPGYAKDSAGAMTLPTHIFRLQDESFTAFSIEPAGLGPEAVEAWKGKGSVQYHSLASDVGGRLWVARGPWGLTRSPLPPSSWNTDVPAIPSVSPVLLLNPRNQVWDTLALGGAPDTSLHLPVLALAIDSSANTFWIGSEKGMWRGSRDQSSLERVPLGDSLELRISGIWRDPTSGRILVESSRLEEGKSSQTHSSLWRSIDQGLSFHKLSLPYDSLDLSVSGMASLGDTDWVAVLGMGNTQSGLLRIGPQGAEAWPDSLRIASRPESSPFLWSVEAGILDRDVAITGITRFPLGGRMALAISTDGAGVAVSADSGKTWKPILNQTRVAGNLQEVRLIPSVMRGYGASSIAYRLGENAKVSIDVFSYDMKRVRAILRHATRNADPIRSSDPRFDFWDGRDDQGRAVSAGMYFVRVRDQRGNEAWGKILVIGGQP